jgi:hypothetical protein
MSKHKVQLQHWHDGELRTLEHYFDTIEEAVSFANLSKVHSVKVYDKSGELVQSVQNTELEQYSPTDYA